MNTTAGADERLVVMLEARISEFEKRMAKAEGTGTRTYQKLRQSSQGATQQMEADMNRASGRIGQAVSSITGQIGSFGKAFIGGFVAGAVVEALRTAIVKVNELAVGVAQVGDEARRAGMSAREFQEWGYVAEQNRIGIDSLVDGIKELQLRGDEFAVTGKGSAAEAFERLGYSAEEVARKLEDPSALMLEILGRLELMDKAAQIRIADELFGGTGGERFVELLDQGVDRIRETKDEAGRLGIVMSDELIAKADQLNREFNTVASTVGVALKSAIISAAASLSDFIDGFRAFENQRSTTLQMRQTEIMRERADLHAEAQSLRSSDGLTDNARSLGFGPDSAVTQNQIAELQSRIDDLTAEEDRIIGILSSRPENTWTPKKDTWTPPPTTTNTDTGKKTKSRGGADEFKRAVEQTEKQIAANQAEAASLEQLAQAGNLYGGSLEYARKRAELLVAAQQAGVDLTPEMISGIEQLAQAYVESGEAASEAARRMKDVETATARGKDALGGVFDAIVEGGGRAKEAIAGLLMEIAKAQFKKSMFGMIESAGGGGFLAGLGSLMSFDGGGNTGNGARAGGLDGKGGFLAMVHPRERIIDETRGGAAAQIEIVGGGLELTDNGQIMARVQAVSRQSAQAAYSAAITDTRRNLGAWNDQYRQDGALT